MRNSADSDDYGVSRRGRKRGWFENEQPAHAKRGRLTPRLEAEDASDATDGLPEGDRWSTWDTGAPRLAETRPDAALLASLWEQFTAAPDALARHGLAHGDLSPYNLLVHQGRLVMIDLPQVVDVIAHPAGRDFLARDARNVATWFAARGLPAADPDALTRRAVEQAGLALGPGVDGGSPGPAWPARGSPLATRPAVRPGPPGNCRCR